MKRSFGKLIFMALLIGLLTACGTSDSENEDSAASETNSTVTEDVESADEKVLKMATSADFPPFESYDINGEFEGFDIELAQLIADELGYELEIEDMGFDGLIGALQSETVDIVMSGMSATEKRRQNVDFSIEYHRSGEMFVSQADAGIEVLEDLEGKVVGVQLGTIQEEGADKLSDEYGFEVKKLDDANTLIQELNTNRIDVAYMDKTVAVGYINELGLVGFDDPTTVSPGMAIAFPKDSEMIEEVNTVLEELIDSGKVEELEDKWLSEE
ncbi:ABC transporter substrate-binding protein [Oceanobacillus bengalensis]|uniref:Amino acid ABC transporter substrate-binding protein n=1 Tax=Oceanobacillus bengalensis TaxID=1435466 RepID=A0A494Z3M8_9BACI|nr:ABC transporter substrate-binding protein [Oceanobacillus bengalensis]RKQ16904.1 amino acid ABC transporter substrate-binding protein [Oceanobacillus bengalensis]